ncbi:hypothetical protein C8R46DRAFT_1269975 [Mycena filopes]|nr:hypothetical protein C8R46DRAFT_1269975 [Mycena filopes]
MKALALLLYISTVLADPLGPSPTKRETNFDRIRRGLPPFPPRTERNQNLKQCTPDSQAQPAPPSPGYIKVTGSNTAVGYLAPASAGYYAPVPARSGAQLFTLPSTSAFRRAINIGIASPPDAGQPYLGGAGVAVTGGYDLGFGSPNYANVIYTASHTPGRPADTPPLESQIWTLSCTLQITAQWTNSDGSMEPTTFVAVAPGTSANRIVLTADATRFEQSQAPGGVPVVLTWEPL